MTFKEFDFTVSTSFICPLVYGDVSGLEADDIAALDSFLEKIGKNCGHAGAWDFSTDSAGQLDVHSGRCDICRLHSDVVCAVYTVQVAD